MDHSTRFKIWWTAWMSVGGIAVGVVVYVLTGSVGWTIVGLLGSGVVLNAIGQAVVQPIRAVRGAQRDAHHHR